MNVMPPIVLVVEKPSCTRHLAPFAAEAWPDRSIFFLHTLSFAAVRFARSQACDGALPGISEPVFELTPEHDWRAMQIVGDGAPVPAPEVDPLDLLREGELVFACDLDASGVVTFANVVRLARGSERISAHALAVVSLAPACLAKTFANMGSFDQLHGLLRAGERKRFFDWNWGRLAAHVFDPWLAEIGTPKVAAPLSKWEVQTLGILRLKGPLGVEALLSAMPGSPTSQLAIVQTLKSRGFVADAAARQLALSTDGHALCARLGRTGYDPTLPAALAQWCTATEGDPKAAMAEYLRAFFDPYLPTPVAA